MTTTNLSNLRPDQPQQVLDFQAILAAKPAWKDLYASGTGQTLIEMIANMAATDLYSIEQAYKQVFPDTSMTDSAIYATTRELGVRIPRKNPASMTATLTRTDATAPLTIEAYSAFSSSNTNLFNRSVIVFPAGVLTVQAVLYEGSVRKFSLLGQGTDFQMFRSSEQGFQVSDQDTVVKGNNTVIPTIYSGIWNYRSANAVFDTTTKDGELLLTFGNSQFGYKPGVNVQIDISYVITKGLSGGNAALSGKTVTYLGSTDITGVVGSGGLTDGGDELDVDTLRLISPLLYSAQGNKATTESELTAVALSYPGVKDARVVGQHKVSPTDVRYMNLARVSLLTSTGNPSSVFYNDFEKWFQKRTMYPLRFFRQDPISILVNLGVNVYCYNTADLNSVKANILEAITKLFAVRAGFIGFNVYRSDIYDAIMSCDEGIAYIELLSPSQDLIVDITAPNNLMLAPVSGGTLVAGNYSYGVSAINSTGESLVTNFTTVTTASTGSISLTWDPMPGATGYRIYGRTPIDRGFVAAVGANVYTYTDTGSATITGPLPSLDSSGVHYAKEGTVNINMYYTQRS